MSTTLLIIAATALLSSIGTLGLAYIVFRWRMRDALREALDRELEKAIATLGDEIEVRVRQGVVDGVAAIPTTEVLHKSTRSAVRTGADLIEGGLDVLLGGRGRNTRDDR